MKNYNTFLESIKKKIGIGIKVKEVVETNFSSRTDPTEYGS